MCSRDSGSRPLCPWNPDPNRLYALRLALVIFSSTLVWILCFIVVVLMIPKWVACSTYKTPVLLYGKELLLPSSKPLEQLELFEKRILKQILSLLMSCPNPAVYILTGILPIEAQIHIKALTFFNNVCHQGKKKHWEKACKTTNNREGGI
jgi:hypothetical protein